MPTHLTIACFLPNPDADENFRKKQQIKQGDAWIIPREEIGEKVEIIFISVYIYIYLFCKDKKSWQW